MPLPEKAFECLPFAMSALSPEEGTIHYYDFQHAEHEENPLEPAKKRVCSRLRGLRAKFDSKQSDIKVDWSPLVPDSSVHFGGTLIWQLLIRAYGLSNAEGIDGLKRKLMEILACPIDKFHPLELYVFEEKDEIAQGLIVCPKCLRWYPIRDEIPEMLPDELRKENEDLPFLKKWQGKVPKKIVEEGNPFRLGTS